jgi:RNA polymerase sigma factor (sigma-70 family)
MKTSALVAAARTGDLRAFATLVERYYPMALATCARFLGDGDLALDVTQEAVVTVMLSLDRLRHDDRFGAWMTGIALNLCRRTLSSRDRAVFSLDALLGDGVIAELPAGGLTPDDAAVSADIARRVREAIAGLPDGQRAAVESYYLAGLATAEAATVLGVPAGAVKTRLHKARATLRDNLGDLRPEAAGSRAERKDTMSDEGTTMVPVTISATIISREALREQFEFREEPGGEPAETGHQVRYRANHHFIVLTENGGERALHIGVGATEAVALGMTQSGQEFPRPMTYQFAASLLAGSGTGLREVRITRITDGIFYAQAVLTNGTTVDARPSDAVNLAAITGAPVLVAADLLDLPAGPDQPGHLRVAEQPK